MQLTAKMPEVKTQILLQQLGEMRKKKHFFLSVYSVLKKISIIKKNKHTI